MNNAVVKSKKFAAIELMCVYVCVRVCECVCVCVCVCNNPHDSYPCCELVTPLMVTAAFVAVFSVMSAMRQND